MRAKRTLIAALVVLPLLMFGCQSAVDRLTGTFINERDPNQILKLTPDVSQTTNVLIRVGIETGASKFFGKTVGRYSLQTTSGIRTGKFVSFKPIHLNVQNITLNPDQGPGWTLTGEADGSFRDSSDVIWRLQVATGV